MRVQLSTLVLASVIAAAVPGCQKAPDRPVVPSTPPQISSEMPVLPTAPPMPPPQPSSKIIAYNGPFLSKLPSTDAATVKVTLETFQEDQKAGDAAMAKYAEKWVEVEGPMSNFSIEPFTGGQYFVMAHMAPPKSTNFLACWMANGERPWEQAMNGATITIRGAYGKPYGTDILAECRIIKPSEPTMLNLTVDELAKLYEANPGAFNKAQNKKQAVVRGTFAGFVAPSAEDDANNWVALEGADGRRFYSHVGGSAAGRRPFEGYKTGEQLTVLGDFFGLLFDDKPFEDLIFQPATNLTPFLPKPEK